MTKSDIEVPARYYARIGELLIQQGIDLQEVMRSTKLSAQALAEPDASIRFSQADRLLNCVAEASGRTDLAFELGRILTVGSHAFVGFAMLNSANLDEALRFEARYFRLVMPSFCMRYLSGPDFGQMHLLPVVPMSSLCLRFHLEAIATAALREFNDLTGNRAPQIEIDLSIPEPAHAARYRDLPGVKVRFGSLSTPGVRLRLLGNPRRYILPIADIQARQLAEERCKALIRHTTNERKTADWVEMTLREAGEGLPSLEDLADLLNISKRTLNRHLEREGTSYRELSNRIQHEIACKRLAVEGMTVSEVAYSLGFSDVSNFARAFRTLAGCSPSTYAGKAAATRPARPAQHR